MNRRTSWLSPLKFLFITALGLWGFGVLTGTYLASRKDEVLPQVAPLLKQIQQLGQLHTVRYNLHDIYQHERTIEPEGWVSSLPGARSFYRAATKNSVLVVAEGGIEAGIDLSRISAADVARVATPEGAKLRVRLPHAMLYTPDVKVRVVNRRAGVFWKDENIVPEATEEVKRRFSEAAGKGEILAAAETNAVKVLSNMQELTGSRNVEFTF